MQEAEIEVEKAGRAMRVTRGHHAAAVPSFSQSRSGASLIQDLSDIATFCHLSADELKKTLFDFRMVDETGRAVKDLADALAQNECRKTLPSEILEKRNRTCKEIYKTMVDICGIGRHVFRNDPDRRKAYKSRD